MATTMRELVEEARDGVQDVLDVLRDSASGRPVNVKGALEDVLAGLEKALGDGGELTAAASVILQPPALEIDKVLHPDGRIPPRERVERRLVWNLLAKLAAAGWIPDSVDEEAVKTPEEVMEMVFNLDDARVFFQKGLATAWVRIVLGNDGWDAVCDWAPANGGDFDKVMEAFDGEAYA